MLSTTMGVVLLNKEEVGKRCPLLYFSTVRLLENPSSPPPSQVSPSYTTGCCSPETRPQPEGHLHLPTGGVVALSTYSTCGGLTSTLGQGPWSLTSAVETRLQCRWRGTVECGGNALTYSRWAGAACLLFSFLLPARRLDAVSEWSPAGS